VKELRAALEDFGEGDLVYVQAVTAYKVAIVVLPAADEQVDLRAGRFADGDDTVVVVTKLS
jgi:hypothetical protein